MASTAEDFGSVAMSLLAILLPVLVLIALVVLVLLAAVGGPAAPAAPPGASPDRGSRNPAAVWLTASVPAIAVPAFVLTWWMASYLVARDPARPVLRRAAAGLVAYALAVALWTIAPYGDGASLDTAAQVLLCVPALAWAGAAVGLLPDDLPDRRHLDRGWLLTSGLLLLMVPVLPPVGRLVVLAPLIGALMLLWRFHHRVEPKVLAAPLTVAAALYATGLAAVLIPIDTGAPMLVIAATGVDLAALGFLVAVADAVVAGERLPPDLRRSAVAAMGAAVVFGGPATLTMLTAPGAGRDGVAVRAGGGGDDAGGPGGPGAPGAGPVGVRARRPVAAGPGDRPAAWRRRYRAAGNGTCCRRCGRRNSCGSPGAPWTTTPTWAGCCGTR